MINLYETIKEHPEYFKQLVCRDILFTQYDCPQLVDKQDLYSQCNYIAYVLSGKRIFHQPDQSLIMTEGKCVFAKKGAWLAEKESGEGWCVIVFFIPDNYLNQFIKEYRTNLPLKHVQTSVGKQMMELDVNDTTKNFFYSMLPYFVHNPPPPEDLLELKFRELIFNILINTNNKELLYYLCSIADCDKQPLSEIMEANYTYNLSLAEFAKISHRSLASFKREFKEVYNTTPSKWLIDKRLAHANLLLHTSSKSISDISFESGFENVTHFSRVFKEKFGSSPLNLKKQILVS